LLGQCSSESPADFPDVGFLLLTYRLNHATVLTPNVTIYLKKVFCQLRNSANGLFAETKSADEIENLNGTK